MPNDYPFTEIISGSLLFVDVTCLAVTCILLSDFIGWSPSCIRDGVSESQFDQVLKNELGQIIEVFI